MPAAALIMIGGVLVVVGFFLPWFHGDGIFALRTFSGFGLARELRTLTTSIDTVRGGALSPLLFYIAPAGAVGVALYTVLAEASTVSKALSFVAGTYTLALVAVALVLATTTLTDAGRYLGAPSWGLGVTVAGAMLMLASGFRHGAQ